MNQPTIPVIIFLLFAMVIISVAFGALARRSGDDQCACVSKTDYTWRGFSISWFVMTFATAIFLVFSVARQGGSKNAFSFGF
jgi:hypothetical protein